MATKTKKRINFYQLAQQEQVKAKTSLVLRYVFSYISGTPNTSFFWPLNISFFGVEGLSTLESAFMSRNLKFYKEAKRRIQSMGFVVKQKAHQNNGYPTGKFIEWEISRKKKK